MLWFIPTTHKLVIASLLVIAALAFALFWVTLLVRRRRRPHELDEQATVRHGTGPRDE
ncbi:MAG: hypothetical protein ACREQM_20210 [Candidatus Dormibacteraceae bacterium]